MGISKENIEKIWQRLYRADASRTSEGLGIGLSVVKTIINAHHGKVGVESTLGVGSSFIIRLPVCND